MLNGTDQTARPYDIYARVSRVKSKKKNELLSKQPAGDVRPVGGLG